MASEEKKSDPDEAEEPEEAEAPADEEAPAEVEAEEAEAPAPADDEEEAEAEEAPAPSAWEAKVLLAHELWEAGDNARLRGVVAELAGAPADQTEAREVGRDYAKRLRPDPVAIALWALSLGVFCVITYLFVLR